MIEYKIKKKGGRAMSLRDEFDQAVREKNARDKQKGDLQALNQLLPKEVLQVYSGWSCRTGAYEGSLPLELEPEVREMI